MSYPAENKTGFPDHNNQQYQYNGQPSGVHSPPPNYQQPFAPDHQQQYQQQQTYGQQTYDQRDYQSPPPQSVQSPQPVHQQSFTQPPPQPQMETKGVHSGQSGQPSDWEHGMCGCFGDMGKCCMTCWCPCITYGRIQHRLRNNTNSEPSNCNGHCWGFCGLMCLCGVQWVLGMMQRGEIRHRYNLDGSGIGDCCRHFWCECCTLIQEDRETETRKALLVPAHQTGYQQQPGMQYPGH
ncbi:hypothetical protein H072_11534 [Dactylellina haptotyla CBS 200.50]|uniref:Uncharacterized protein n=1 Tax=Dactylellina haptotyla (strain CBS 200.50) TaxID=1284197 RepID=S8B836_DACHA|nr:hypothetical protein H072_11534 [Dactylellina haptotyla CBS 200.50]